MQWSEDGTHLAFVSTSREHKQEWVRIADAATGDGSRRDDGDGAEVF